MVFYVPFLVSMAHEATSFFDKRTLRLGQQGTEQEPSDQILHLPTEAPPLTCFSAQMRPAGAGRQHAQGMESAARPRF